MGDMMIDTVIFDLDGTLLNTLDDLADSVNAALLQNGLPLRTVEEVRAFVGNGVYNLMVKAVGDVGHPAFPKAFADFKAHYALHCLDKTAPYEGIMPLLAELSESGYKLAVVSNKFDPAVKKLNEQFFGAYIPVAIGEKETVRKKPAPDSVFAAMEALGSKAETCIYVGDSDVDIFTAQNAGIPCISVTWGFRDRAFLASYGADKYADTPAQIKLFLK